MKCLDREPMNILVTGNKGYIGCILTKLLLERGYNVTGFDTDYYRGCELTKIETDITQIHKDIRTISKTDLRGIDAIIHLAALSNDPLGELNPSLTYDINYVATLRLATLAKEIGVTRFVYSSSQSMYGIAKTDQELNEDTSEKNPLTVYAKTKWDAECGLKNLGNDDFTVVCFRPSTVFGASPRLRCDIVYNNFIANAYTTGKIEVKSDGSPWRPVVHVRDVSNAFIAGLEAPKKLISNEAFNVGIKDGNFTVKQLAEAAQKVVEGSTIVYTGEHGSDARTYRVSFAKILSVLKDYYKPEWDLVRGGNELVAFFNQIQFTEAMFRGGQCNRTQQLKYLMKNKKVNDKMYWMT
jgi:nucleoside-diphosphate-sugar epimerase